MKAFGDNLNRDFIIENSFQKSDDFLNSRGNGRKVTGTLSEFLLYFNDNKSIMRERRITFYMISLAHAYMYK